MPALLDMHITGLLIMAQMCVFKFGFDNGMRAAIFNAMNNGFTLARVRVDRVGALVWRLAVDVRVAVGPSSD